MEDRAAELIRILDLHAHVEGGFYREVFRSAETVQPTDDRDRRSALTSIYFLLTAGKHSSWHVVLSDEIWHYYEGAPLELLTIAPESLTLKRQVLGPIHETQEQVHPVKAGDWQAARTLGAYTLVGASVGPGYEYDDFSLMRDDPVISSRLKDAHPETIDLL